MHRNLFLGLIAAVAVAALVAGCGSDSSSASAESLSANSLSKAAYLKEANAFCARKHRERIAAANAFLKTHRTQASGGIEVLIKHVYMPAMASLVSGLRRLGAPQGDEQAVEALIVALEGRARATENGNVAERELKRFKKAEIAGAKYGLNECHG